MSMKKGEAPKVTLEELKASIKKETYTLLPNGRTTVCQLTLDNGFTVEGSSSCVSLENYDKEVGEEIACKNACDNLWQLLGMRLADRLHQAKLRKARGAKYRDASSGFYVTKEYAKLNPTTTVKES
jgi:hypothetical protein